MQQLRLKSDEYDIIIRITPKNINGVYILDYINLSACELMIQKSIKNTTIPFKYYQLTSYTDEFNTISLNLNLIMENNKYELSLLFLTEDDSNKLLQFLKNNIVY